jgi:hypothetical protein
MYIACFVFSVIQTCGTCYIGFSEERGERKAVRVIVMCPVWGLGVLAQVGVWLTYASLLMIQ